MTHGNGIVPCMCLFFCVFLCEVELKMLWTDLEQLLRSMVTGSEKLFLPYSIPVHQASQNVTSPPLLVPGCVFLL